MLEPLPLADFARPPSDPEPSAGPGRAQPLDEPARSARQTRNRRRLAADHKAARVQLGGRPAHLKIELTNFCNLACPMCPHSQMQRPVGYMTPELFRRIIDQAAPELEFAYLHHLGESLFHPRIGELIAYGKRRGVAMGLSTNASFLSAQKTGALLAGGLDFLVISLDANSPASYAHMRTGGDFQRTAANVRHFFAAKAAAKSPIRVVVQMIVSAHNQHEIADFARAWDGQVVLKVARDWAGQVPLTALRPRPPAAPPAAPPVGKLLPNESPRPLAGEGQGEGGRAGTEPSPHLSRKRARGRTALLPETELLIDPVPCRMLWTELTVLWDGQVVPCANVYEHENLLGDLRTQTLDEVWNGAPLQALRRAHLANAVAAIPVCRTCPRHRFDREDFVAVNQLTQRLRNYVGVDLTPRSGLS